MYCTCCLLACVCVCVCQHTLLETLVDGCIPNCSISSSFVKGLHTFYYPSWFNCTGTGLNLYYCIFMFLFHIYAHTYTHTYTHNTVALIVRSLPDAYVEKLLMFLAQQVASSPHLQFYLAWSAELLTAHCAHLKESSSNILASIRDLQKSITQKQNDLGRMWVCALYIASYVKCEIFLFYLYTCKRIFICLLFFCSCSSNEYMLRYVLVRGSKLAETETHAQALTT